MSYEFDPTLDLGQRLTRLAGEAVRFRKGVVTDDSPLSVALGGASVPYTDVRAVGGVRPMVGEVVGVLMWGNDLLVLGAIRPARSPTWSVPSFRTNYVDYGATDPDFRVGYMRDAAGVVWLRGIVSRVVSAWTSGDVMFTLPVGYRPQQRLMSSGRAIFNGTAGTARIDVRADGSVILQAVPGTWGGATNLIGLDEVRFPAA